LLTKKNPQFCFINKGGNLIIEWVGCSGAGKSTLLDKVYKNLRSEGVDVRKPLDIFLGRTIANIISNERLQKIFLDIFILPWSIISVAKHWLFFNYCLNSLNNGYFSFGRKVLLLRSIFRTLGLYFFLNNPCNEKRPIMFDEGTVQIAHILFAHEDRTGVTREEIESFCKLVPTPDLIVHIMAPKAEVISRSLSRQDKPIAETSPDKIKRFITLGFEIFKTMNDLDPWNNKTFTLFNSDQTKPQDALNITNQIIDILPS
jgi:hypothetical protein